MPFDTLLYAIVAVVILIRLWSVFGQRNDGESQRPNPFTPLAPKTDEPPSAGPALALDKPVTILSPFRAAPESLAGGLEQIKNLDPTFDEKKFLDGARSAFTMIIDDFAKGDLSRCERLLGPAVRPHFQAALDARRQANQTAESRIARFRDVETAAAKVDGKIAFLTVCFVTEQENIVRDAAGQILHGGIGKIEEITDLWTFARDTSSLDPNWRLVETRS